MNLQVPITFETLLDLVKQLPSEKQDDLLNYLVQQSESRILSSTEKKALYHASILDMPIKEEPSIRRSDWYDDDGR